MEEEAQSWALGSRGDLERWETWGAHGENRTGSG